jgi:hypothetical protein
MVKKAEILNQEFKLTFAQDSDCLSTEDQFLTIKTDNGGGGDFFVIETERWSFDSFDELIELFNKFKEKHEKIKE